MNDEGEMQMTFDSSSDTVGILYDIENAPYEMLDFTLSQARRFQPCRIIVVTDWDKCPTDQKRWERLRRRPGFTFRSVTRTYLGKNSLDNALYDSAVLLYQDGVRRYFIITTDSDFVKIAEALNAGEKSYIIGVGTKQASETLRNAYDEFLVYPPEPPKKEEKQVRKASARGSKAAQAKETGAAKQAASAGKGATAKATAKGAATAAGAKGTAKGTGTGAKATATKKAKGTTASNGKAAKETKNAQTAAKAKATRATKATKAAKSEVAVSEAASVHGGQSHGQVHGVGGQHPHGAVPQQPHSAEAQHPHGTAAQQPHGAEAQHLHGGAEVLAVRLPRTLQHELEQRRQAEGVSMDELVTYLLMRGLH